MYLQAMEGAWLSHPFWKTKFVLTDQADLAALKASGVPAVWIDNEKGIDVIDAEPVKPSPIMTAPAPAPAPVAAPAPAPAVPQPRVSMEAELDRAAQVLNRSKVAVMALFGEARLGKAIDSEVCLPIVEEVASSLARNPSAFVSLARLKTRDDYTYMHSVAVCGLMVALAQDPAEHVNREALKYINRVSDFLFVAARAVNDNGKADVLWVPGKNR